MIRNAKTSSQRRAMTVTRTKKQEQAPLKPALQAVNMARVQLGGGAPRLHHLVGHVVAMSRII